MHAFHDTLQAKTAQLLVVNQNLPELLTTETSGPTVTYALMLHLKCLCLTLWSEI